MTVGSESRRGPQDVVFVLGTSSYFSVCLYLQYLPSLTPFLKPCEEQKMYEWRIQQVFLGSDTGL